MAEGTTLGSWPIVRAGVRVMATRSVKSADGDDVLELGEVRVRPLYLV